MSEHTYADRAASQDRIAPEPATYTRDLIRTITEDALAAFWSRIAETCPEIGSGDIDPITYAEQLENAERTVAVWLRMNGATIVEREDEPAEPEYVECGYEHPGRGHRTECGDEWTCRCGNNVTTSGFYPVDERGKEVEPTPEAWTSGRVMCAECLREIESATGRILSREESAQRA